jgi:hypothetical protein
MRENRHDHHLTRPLSRPRRPRQRTVRFALTELVRAAGLVRRIGINLNQAVAKLNATGQRSGDLVPYAAESIRRSQRQDTLADQVRNAIPRHTGRSR